MRSDKYTLNVRAVALLIVLMSLTVACQQTAPEFDVERTKIIAGELRTSKLYHAAIDEYKAILERGQIDDKSRGNINYLIARIYFDDLKDFENAAAYYVRARSFDPEGSYMNEASRNLVTSLEKIGHIVDAKRELSAVADVDPEVRPDGDVPVALISQDTVWLSEVDAQIQTLPPQVQQQFLQKEAKTEFVRQYVGAELLYQAAIREGYDRDAEILKNRELLFKRLLVEKFVGEKVMPEVRIDTADVRNYYLANKTSIYEDRPYDSVRYQVYMDYQTVKAEAAYSEYIGRLVQSENVLFIDDNVH